MKLIIIDGLPVLGTPIGSAPPLVEAVEARGALLEWELGAAETAPPAITLLDASEADWLYLLLGEDAHVAILDAISGGAAGVIEPAWDAELLVKLRKFAHGLWLRDWWPVSPPAFPALDLRSLDHELAELAEELELVLDDEALPDLARSLSVPAASRADFALVAAGAARADEEGAIASGTAAVAWQGVPRGAIDATEQPIRWSVDAAPDPTVRIQASTPGEPRRAEGLRVVVELDGRRLADGALGANARADLPLALTAGEAWAADWTGLTVAVGQHVDEPAELRERVRQFARSRRGATDGLAFAAEADDDY